jgi:peptide/nickel transport system substrate-binding protein
VESQIFERLAELGPNMNTLGDLGFVPMLATGWTWAKDSLSIAFHLDPRARWHDGKPVTAGDVRFTLDLNRDSTIGSVMRPLVASIDSVTVRDSLTPVFWFSRRYPEQFFDAAWQMRILPAHVLASVPRKDIANGEFRRNPVGSGPFKFVTWEPHQAIVVEANGAYHLGRPHLDRVVWSIAPDPNASILRVLAGDADFLSAVRPSDLSEIAKHPQVRTLWYADLSYAFLLFNERDPRDTTKPHPVLGDRAVRRALSMAVDRAAIVKSVFDTLAVTGSGPVTHNYPTYDPSIALLPYAPDSAAKLLDAAGWKRGADGMRSKNGRPLAFGIVVPSSSTTRNQMAVLLQNAYKQVGVALEIQQMDFAGWVQRAMHRGFDATFITIGLDPSPGNLRQSWGSTAAGPGTGNLGAYVSPTFNAYVDSALHAMDRAKAKAYFKRAYETIIGDAPAIWMYEPRSAAVMQARIHPVDFRPDAWWTNVREWYIPAAERNARDRAAALQLPPPPPPAPPAAPTKR